MKPLNNRLYIDTVITKITASGIILPDDKKDKPNKGKVVASDEHKELIGRMVWFNAYTALKLNEKDENVIVKYEDLYAILD